jgi:hypothetical protein
MCSCCEKRLSRLDAFWSRTNVFFVPRHRLHSKTNAGGRAIVLACEATVVVHAVRRTTRSECAVCAVRREVRCGRKSYLLGPDVDGWWPGALDVFMPAWMGRQGPERSGKWCPRVGGERGGSGRTGFLLEPACRWVPHLYHLPSSPISSTVC